MYELRNYQKSSVEAGLDFITEKQDNRKGMIVAPTGAGKSLIIAGLVNEISSPTVVVQPSKELLEQNYEKYTSYGNEASVFSASLNSKEIGHVTFGTPGSLVKHTKAFKDQGVKVVIIDECHLGSAHTGQMGRFLTGLGKVKIIGLTATPILLMNDLMEGPMLKMLNRTRKSMFNHFLHITQVKEVIEGGFWADLFYREEKINESKLSFNSSRSEFTEESQNEVYNENMLADRIAAKVEKIKDLRKSILIFVPSVEKAQELAEFIPGSYAVWGNMDPKKRAWVIENFKTGIIKVVINVNVLAVGFDFPALDTVIDASPTASFGRYYQKLGRVCRPHPSKKNGVIIDYAGNHKRFGDLSDLIFEEDPALGWAMFSGDRLLTGVALGNEAPVYRNKNILFKRKTA